MFSMLAPYLKDVSVLRRLLFAVTHLPQEIPNHIGIAIEFATSGKVERNRITEDLARSIIDNIDTFDSTAFVNDEQLLKELLGFRPSKSRPLGIVHISPLEVVCTCTV